MGTLPPLKQFCTLISRPAFGTTVWPVKYSIQTLRKIADTAEYYPLILPGGEQKQHA